MPLGTKRIETSFLGGLYEVVMHCLEKNFYFNVLEYDLYLIYMKEMDIYNFESLYFVSSAVGKGTCCHSAGGILVCSISVTG